MSAFAILLRFKDASARLRAWLHDNARV